MIGNNMARKNKKEKGKSEIIRKSWKKYRVNAKERKNEKDKGKGKVHPRTGHEGPEGE